MKMTSGLIAASAAMLLYSGLVLSQGTPPIGAPQAAPAGAAMGAGPMPAIADTAEEAAAKQVVIEFGKLVDAGKVEEAFQKYISKDFNDHSNTPRRMTGKQKIGYAEALEAFKGFIGPRPGNFVDQIVANESMVTIRGKVGRDLFMVKDGKITDHWDTLHDDYTSATISGGPATR